jgi:2-oxoglutarate ferredoxin oxidoreductase subunit alpha
VIFDVQRVGPSTGLQTRTAQGDVRMAAWCSHGDTQHLVLHPGGPEECFDFARISFDLAEQFQTPVFVMLDLDLGMNFWMAEPPAYPTDAFKRGKVLTPEQLDQIKAKGKKWGRYLDADGDGVPWRALPGNPHPDAAYFTRGSGHDEYARYTEDPEAYRLNMDRLKKKTETARQSLPRPVLESVPGARIGIIAYGSTNNAMREARDQLIEHGLKTDYLRLRATPLPMAGFEAFLESDDRVTVVRAEPRRADGDADPRRGEDAGADREAARCPLLHRLPDRRALDQRRYPEPGARRVAGPDRRGAGRPFTKDLGRPRPP